MRVLGFASLAAGALLLLPGALAAAPLSVVAAENFYGDVAAQLAGPDVAVSSILSNPDDDPHLFEASPSVARALADAAIVVESGADYDPWMDGLLKASMVPGRKVIVVADLVHRKPGDNPHIWYDPKTMLAFAQACTAALVAKDPDHAAAYQQRLATFIASIAPVTAKIAALRPLSAGKPVTATEPVFGYMAAALGFTMRNERFQIAVMNNAEPRPSDVAAFEDDLRRHRVRILFYNSQASDDAAKRLLAIAGQGKVPVVGVTETEPAGKTYQTWMSGTLEAVEQALSTPAS